jgi:hypothetical protein
MPPEPLTEIRAAINGLLYPSDSDEPFEIVTAPSGDTSDKSVRQLLAIGAKPRHQERPVAEFFTELEPDAGFQKLHQVLDQKLTDLKVHCYGKVNVIVALAGKAADGQLVVLKTKSVET